MSVSWFRRAWAPDAAVGLAVLLLGLLEVAWRAPSTVDGRQLLLVVSAATVVGGSRRAPGAALALAALVSVAQVLAAAPFLLVQVGEASVLFGCVRWGNRATLWLSGLAAPLAAGLVLLHAAAGGPLPITGPLGGLSIWLSQSGANWAYVVLVTAVTLLGLPWLAGLTVRFAERARAAKRSQEAAEADTERAHAERSQAQEIAALQEEQARLARDVHDVVGHSLAVILAQAESAQYLPDDEDARDNTKRIMQNIATSARSSLQDVRHVLTDAPADAGGRAGRLDDILTGVRAGGQEVIHTEHGTERPLAPDVRNVALRVLQESLTNAVKHGRRSVPVRLDRHWPQRPGEHELRIQVRNAIAAEPRSVPSAGLGLAGMRQRLALVGGRLDIQRGTGSEGEEFQVTAWIPVRTESR
ncbi:histidine kinase [Streptomyces sp. NBC_01485]|uniref:sensor histidine kinase n=1 Tax=Streptomyces sp. NBC_01485 TaxID=2903884 RepID=UPI002E34DADA|nr:histidine kinase [Streptomyces sp. NBC_01485]